MNFPVLIITPKRKVFDGQVELLSVMTTAGQLGILANHTPLLTILKTGPMHLIVDKKTIYFAVSGGVLSVQKNQTILLVDAIGRRFKTRLITEINGLNFLCPKLFLMGLINCLVFLGFPGSIMFVAEILFFSFFFDLFPLLCLIFIVFLYLLGPTFFFRS